MSREIKFRAWDTVNNRWFRTELEWKGFSIFGELMYSGLPNMDMLPHIELQQFTGLKDKNGKEVYEGDIVTLQQSYVKPIAVYWNEEMTGYYPLLSERGHNLEVIGNIHENPELLK